MLAASGGNGEMVPLLLEAGADINAQDTVRREEKRRTISDEEKMKGKKRMSMAGK